MSNRTRMIGALIVGVSIGVIITNVVGSRTSGEPEEDLSSSVVAAEGEGCVDGTLQRPWLAVPILVDFLATGMEDVESGNTWKPELDAEPQRILLEFDSGQCIQMTCLEQDC